MIFVSTGGVSDQAATKTALDFYNSGILNIELSGGAYSDNYQEELLNLPDEITLQLHNYFPPAKKPFVFNLASVDPETAELSINHVRKAMDLSLKNRSRIQKRSQILAQRSNWAEIARITREVYEECIMNKR